MLPYFTGLKSVICNFDMLKASKFFYFYFYWVFFFVTLFRVVLSVAYLTVANIARLGISVNC